MSYALFLALTFGPLLVGLCLAVYQGITRTFIANTGLLVGIAIAYTIPFDHYAIANGLWTFDPRRITGLAVLSIPVEEIVFYSVWVVSVALFTLLCLRVLKVADE